MAQHGYSFTWRGTTTSAHWFDTEDECLRSFARCLVAMGWTEPKWYEFWRWGETRPPADAVTLMDEERATVENWLAA